jgi:hypothetical protein
MMPAGLASASTLSFSVRRRLVLEFVLTEEVSGSNLLGDKKKRDCRYPVDTWGRVVSPEVVVVVFMFIRGRGSGSGRGLRRNLRSILL